MAAISRYAIRGDDAACSQITLGNLVYFTRGKLLQRIIISSVLVSDSGCTKLLTTHDRLLTSFITNAQRIFVVLLKA